MRSIGICSAPAELSGALWIGSFAFLSCDFVGRPFINENAIHEITRKAPSPLRSAGALQIIPQLPTSQSFSVFRQSFHATTQTSARSKAISDDSQRRARARP